MFQLRKFRVEPHVRPAAHHRVRIVVAPEQLVAKLAARIGSAERGDGGEAHILHEDVRGLQDEAANAGADGPGVDQGDRGAVGVADQDRFLDPRALEERWQGPERLVVHEGDRALERRWVRATVAKAAVDERRALGGCGELGREVAPGGGAAEALVQEDEGGRPGVDALDLEAAAVDLQERHRANLAHARLVENSTPRPTSAARHHGARWQRGWPAQRGL